MGEWEKRKKYDAVRESLSRLPGQKKKRVFINKRNPKKGIIIR